MKTFLRFTAGLVRLEQARACINRGVTAAR